MAPRSVPRQNNGSDCGVFTLKFADFLSHDGQLLSTLVDREREGDKEREEEAEEEEDHFPSPPLRFTAENMEYFRLRIALEIKLQCVL